MGLDVARLVFHRLAFARCASAGRAVSALAAAGLAVAGLAAAGLGLAGVAQAAVTQDGGPIPTHASAWDAALANGNTGMTRAPLRLSDTGLYRADGTVDPRNLPFAPQYPLWSDGAVKSRRIRLPEGSKIDVSDIDAWRFPPGTTFWKEFAWGGKKIETRMIRVEADGEWTFASYVWNEDQTDALLAPEDGIPAVLEIAPGRNHSIPSRADCLTCHRSSPAVVLGFGALQLSDDRDPLAPHAEPLRPGDLTLRALIEDDRLSPPRPDLATAPPRIREKDPVARAALGYLSANCGGCHNTRGPLARLGFSFLHDVNATPDAPEPALATTAGLQGRFVVPGIAPDLSRILSPGSPDESALFYRMQSRRPASQMPPLGTVLADRTAVELVRQWIAALAAPATPTAEASPAKRGPRDPLLQAAR